jgi:hypothetical protein
MALANQTISNRLVDEQKKLVTEQGTLFLVTGVLISISHYFHSNLFIVFFGHLLIASSIVLFFSMILGYKWTRRITRPLDIFSGTSLIITVTMDIVIFFIDEIVYYIDNEIITQSKIDHLFVSILIAILLWMFLYCTSLIFPAFNVRLPLRVRLPSFIFLGALAVFIVNNYFNIFLAQYVLIAVLLLIFITGLILKRNQLRKLKLNLMKASLSILALGATFFLAGVLSFFTQAVPLAWSLIPAAFFIASSTAFWIRLRSVRRSLFIIAPRVSRGLHSTKNFLLYEEDFIDFQKYCYNIHPENRINLCFFSEEISGSKEDIAWHQFGSFKVIKFKKNRFVSKGIPYDVGEWEQEKWKDAFPQLIQGFFVSRGGPPELP